MDISILENELKALPADQQDRVAGFLTSLRMKRDGLISEITDRLDNDERENWEEWEKVKTTLANDN